MNQRLITVLLFFFLLKIFKGLFKDAYWLDMIKTNHNKMKKRGLKNPSMLKNQLDGKTRQDKGKNYNLLGK